MVITITPTLTNSFHILLRYCLWLPDWQHRQVVATRYPLLRSVVPIDVVLFPRSTISTLTNITCIFYLYSHGCLNASDGIIYLRYRLLSALVVPQMFFSISVSHYTRSSLWHFLQLLTSCTLQAAIDHKYLCDGHDTICSRYRPLYLSVP